MNITWLPEHYDQQIGFDAHGNYYGRVFDAEDLCIWSNPQLLHLTPQLPPQHWVSAAPVWDED